VSRRPCIAIDGPAASGKTTLARALAERLGYRYIDSGAMYRALAWAAHRAGVAADDAERVVALLGEVAIALVPRPGGENQVLVDGRDVSQEIRAPELGELASRLSELLPVRRRMVSLQQQLAAEGGVVMEGRDIQTVVLPEAEVKVFLTATPEERARRRHEELERRGHPRPLEAVLAEVRERDRRDSTREHSPLRAAADAVHLDTTALPFEEVVERVVRLVRERTGVAADAPG